MDASLVRTFDARDAARELAAARSDRTGDAEDLAATDLKIHAAERRQLREPLGPQHHVDVGGCLSCVARLRRLWGAAQHQFDEAIRRQSCARVCAHDDAVAKHRHRLGDLEDLLEVMRHVEDAHAGVPQAANVGEEELDLVGVLLTVELSASELAEVDSQRDLTPLREQDLFGP